jgi:hypothetical protein
MPGVVALLQGNHRFQLPDALGRCAPQLRTPQRDRVPS